MNLGDVFANVRWLGISFVMNIFDSAIKQVGKAVYSIQTMCYFCNM